MGDLDSFLARQAFGDELKSWVRHERFVEYAVGFYVRVIDETTDTYMIGRVDEVRLGRPYVVHEKECTKHLHLLQPTSLHKVFPITKISNDPITEEELEQWNVGLAIMKLPNQHIIDEKEVKRRKKELHKLTQPENRVTKSVSTMFQSQEKRASDRIDYTTSNVLRQSIALFEQKAKEQEINSRPTRSRSSTIQVDQPVILQVSPLAVRFKKSSSKSTDDVGLSAPDSARKRKRKSGSQTNRHSRKLDDDSQQSRSSMEASETSDTSLSDLSEKSDTSATKSGKPEKSSRNSSEQKALAVSDDAVTDQGALSPHSKSEESVQARANKKKKRGKNKPLRKRKFDIINKERKAAALISGVNVTAKRSGSVEGISLDMPYVDSTNESFLDSHSDGGESSRSGSSDLLGSSFEDVKDTTTTTTTTTTTGSVSSTALGVVRSNSGTAPPISSPLRSSQDPITIATAVNTANSDSDPSKSSDLAPTLTSSATNITTSITNTVNEKEIIATTSETPNTHTHDNNDDDNKTESKATETKKDSLEDALPSPMPVIIPALNLTSTAATDSSNAESPKKSPNPAIKGHRRNVSSSGTTFQYNTVSPRNVNLDITYILSRVVIPVSATQDTAWEMRKMKEFEKQAKQHNKEKKALRAEEAAAKEKVIQDNAQHLQHTEREQTQERDAFNKKIQQEKAQMNELVAQQKKASQKLFGKKKFKANMKLTSEHNKADRKTLDDFEKQITLIKKTNKGAKSEKADDELLAQLQQAHKAHLNMANQSLLLSKMQLEQRHEMQRMKDTQELERKHVQMWQQLERECLIKQLTLTQRHMRQKRWVILEDLNAKHHTLRSLQERKHQLEVKQENEAQDRAFRLLTKQQLLERAKFLGNASGLSVPNSPIMTDSESESGKSASNSPALPSSPLVERTQNKEGTLSPQIAEKKRKKIRASGFTKRKESRNSDDVGAAFSNATSAAALSNTSVPGSEFELTILTAHERQLEAFHKERKRRRDLLLLYHQKEKNALQEETELERKEIEDQLKQQIAEFEKGEAEMKVAYTECNNTCLWEVQQRHWLNIGELQKKHHGEQQALVLVANRDKNSYHMKTAKSTANSADSSDNADKKEEEEVAPPEEVSAVQQQLEQQQEAEKLQLEQERAQEQEELMVQLEEEKKEVMETKIVEDELTLRQEYIRKIANDTGLSEELIAKQLDRIGMPSFMF